MKDKREKALIQALDAIEKCYVTYANEGCLNKTKRAAFAVLVHRCTNLAVKTGY